MRTDNRTLQQVVKNLRGMSHAEARALARNLICDDGAITQEDLPELNKAKFQLLDLEGVLSFEHDTARFAEVGGLANLKRWLGERQDIFLNGKGGMPKGMLLVGVQGGGKSLAAKAVAGLWGLPLLRLDFASLYNKFFGETERNLREALKLAEQMAPCVLWMDELEKGLATARQRRRREPARTGYPADLDGRAQGAGVHGGHRQRHLTVCRRNWCARARFDELFFVDLPDAAVRAEIFAIHLRRRELEPEQFDLAALAAAW